MAVFDRSALNPGVRGREVGAWALYDFANSGYTTVVLTAVYNAFFVAVITQGQAWGTLAWTAALALSNALAMLTMPALGAYADAHAAKKRLLAASTVICIVATTVLGFTGPGTVALAVAAIVVSNYAFSVGESLIGAFLPELARPSELGKVSGWGWSFGYFGGMLSLGLCLAWVLSSQAAGRGATQFVPGTMWITAGVFALASIPAFVFLRERACSQPGLATGHAFARLRRTWHETSRFGDFMRLLVCGVFYQAGIAVVIALAAVYADQVMRFSSTQTMVLIFLVNIAAALGAFAFGYAQDRIGHRRALQITLFAWIVMVLLAGFAERVELFWVAACIAGLCMGSSQSCGRAMVGVLAPADRIAEFFGLWAMAVRLAAIIGPLTYGLVTWATDGNHRLGILSTGVFFVVGLALLARIDVERGAGAARDALVRDMA
jgi:UMF1 family MFS transporter